MYNNIDKRWWISFLNDFLLWLTHALNPKMNERLARLIRLCAVIH